MFKELGVFKTLEYFKILELVAAHAVTSLGKKAVLQLLPATHFTQVQNLLAQTDEAYQLLNMGNTPPFGGVTDISASAGKAALGSVLEAGEISMVGHFLEAARRLKAFFAFSEETPLLQDLAAEITVLPKLEQEIERSISPAQTVRDEASPELLRIRREIRSNQSKVKEKLESILRSSSYQKYFQEQLVTMRGDRYVIPVKQEYRQHFPGIVHDQSGSGATVFIEPLSVVELNNEVKKMLAEEKEEVERILRLLSQQIGQNSEQILLNLQSLTSLDLIFAKAKFAQHTKAKRPYLTEKGAIRIKKGRHPLIAPEVVVPVDVQVGDEVSTLIITGSNAGGKTVTLKIIGLFSLMTQTGFFLPAAEETQMPVFTRYFADIGDEQSIEQSLSTFSGQMRNISRILAQADKDMLVLLDEICAGTDPKEGAALAMAILEELQAKGAVTVLTTHYSELKTFALETPGVENASVEFDQVSLEPTYRLLMGLPGSSNAFHIAARLGLAPEIVRRGRSFLDSEHLQLEDILAELERERKEYSEKNAQLERIRQDNLFLQKRLAKQEEEISSKKREIIDKYRQEAAETVREARVEAEKVIKELKALQQEQDNKIRQHTIEKARKKLVAPAIAEQEIKEGEQLTKAQAKIGNWVYIPSLRQKGMITAVSGPDVTVQIGALKTSIQMDKCVLTASKPEEGQVKTGRRRASRELAKTMDFKSEIDVRGQTIEEAILEIDKYLDDALLANIRQVRIIHGKGTGALRKGLLEYFASHPAIRGYETAALNEGGTGATVVFL